MPDVDTILASARSAEEATEWDEAARLYERALTDLNSAGEPFDEADLLTALGRCYWCLSDARAAWRTLRRAMTLYDERGDSVGLARTAIEILRIWGPPERQRQMAEKALDSLADREPYLRAHLLLRLRRVDDALAIADARGYEDLQSARAEREAWTAFDAGRIDDAIRLHRAVHEIAARHKQYHLASAVLRGTGFATLQAGRLDEGEQLCREAVDYARKVHLRFNEQLSLLDLVGVAFARCDFARCESLIAEMPAGTDFRADLYRMWTAELRGDIGEAVALMVDPERAGGAPTAITQIHGASAGVLHHAGRSELAKRELQLWFDVASSADGDSVCDETPVLIDCLLDLGGDDMVRAVQKAYAERERTAPFSLQYATLQGRGIGYARGALALHLGLLDEAKQRFNSGLVLARRERCPIDEARCQEGLSRVASAEQENSESARLMSVARAIYAEHNAGLYLDRVDR